jgi:dipeptidyl aminopeptidase/acylaminoacyl peptidase
LSSISTAPDSLAFMRRILGLFLLLTPALGAQRPFTLRQILSAPYASELIAAPVGARFAWVENAEGVRNLWVGGPNETARAITPYSEDDGQDISGLAWSPDGKAIAYTYGAENGASGRPANPAHLQRPTALHVIIQPLDDKLPPVDVGEGRAPLFTRDGKSLLFLRGGQIWILATASGSDKQCWLPEGCAASPTAAAPAASAGAVGADAAKVHPLVFDRGSASSLTLSPDGKMLAYVSTRHGSDTSHSFIALYDFAAKTLRFVSPSAERDFAPAFSPDGKQLAWLRGPVNEAPEFVNERVSANPWSIQLADVASGEARTIFSPEANKPGSVLPHLATGEPTVKWVAGGKLIFFSEATGWVHLYSINPATNTAPVLLTAGNGEVEDVSLSADGKEIFWASNIPVNMVSYAGLADCMGPFLGLEMEDTERRHLSHFDITKAQKPPPPNSRTDLFTEAFTRKTTGEGIETHPALLSDGSLVALASDSFVPMHPVYVAENTGLLTDVQKDWLPRAYPQNALVFPAEVLLPFSGGFAASKAKVSAQLFLPGNRKASGNDPLPWCNGHKTITLPNNPERHPAIIFVHGGPRRQMLLGYPAMDYYSNAYAMNQYLASRGFIVLSVNYRCGIGYGLDFRQCEGEGAAGAKEYNDALAAQKYLASRPDVDVKRIGIWGGSYGGYLTALALARNSNLFAAGVDFHGVHEWALEDNAPSDWLRGPIVEREKIEALAHASSPMADIDKWRSPVLLIHGDDDPEVAYAQTPMLAEALRARGVHVETLVFPDEVHGFLLHKDWVAAYEAAAEFFERVLKP